MDYAWLIEQFPPLCDKQWMAYVVGSLNIVPQRTV
jgi:hypothetical protein